MIWGGTLPAASLQDARAETTPIYGQAADAVTVVECQEPGRGCDECAAAGHTCLVGSTPIRSGGGRIVYPISVQCPPNVCDECDEVADR